jgi:hypothetical protein
MSSEEFHALLDEYAWESEVDRRDLPLTLARLAEFERQKGVKFPAFYKEFSSMYGAGDFGSITVLSPDPDSQFRISETTSQLENREFNFMGVVDPDSDYFGFLIEQGVCANDIWMCDHEFGYEIGETDYTDFFDFLTKGGLGIWDE